MIYLHYSAVVNTARTSSKAIKSKRFIAFTLLLSVALEKFVNLMSLLLECFRGSTPILRTLS
jgi:hypothetical protein